MLIRAGDDWILPATLTGGVKLRVIVDIFLGSVPNVDTFRPELEVRERFGATVRDILRLRVTAVPLVVELVKLLTAVGCASALTLVLEALMEALRLPCNECFLSRFRLRFALAPGLIRRGISPLETRRIDWRAGDVVTRPLSRAPGELLRLERRGDMDARKKDPLVFPVVLPEETV